MPGSQRLLRRTLRVHSLGRSLRSSGYRSTAVLYGVCWVVTQKGSRGRTNVTPRTWKTGQAVPFFATARRGHELSPEPRESSDSGFVLQPDTNPASPAQK